MLDLVVRNATVVTAANTMRADLGVADGMIVTIGQDVPQGQAEIDATGLLALPGGVDSHVHCEQRGNPDGPELEDFHSLSISAAAGGTTTVISFARQERGEGIAVSVEDYARRAKKSLIDYSFHLTITDPSPAVLQDELPRLIGEGHRSIKIFMTTERSRLEDKEILQVLAVAREHGALVVVHAENFALTQMYGSLAEHAPGSAGLRAALSKPPIVEAEAVHRIIRLAEAIDTPIQIFHVTSGAALEEIERAQRRGARVFAETCPQYLLLSLEELEAAGDDGLAYVFGPPPRTRDDQQALWRGLAAGSIGMVTSDHVPHRLGGAQGKRAAVARGANSIPHGIPGVETRLPLLFSEGVVGGRIDVRRFVALVATNPAKLFGLYPRKGTICIGADADLVLWNPAETRTISNYRLHHKVDYTPYEGRTTTGWPAYTISRGEVVYARGTPYQGARRGRWLAREAYEFPATPTM